jgi:hypothetical protein
MNQPGESEANAMAMQDEQLTYGHYGAIDKPLSPLEPGRPKIHDAEPAHSPPKIQRKLMGRQQAAMAGYLFFSETGDLLTELTKVRFHTHNG